jgi:hypothetical protein
MKIASWDVGIKNLAYCVLEKSGDPERPYIIHDWDIVNISCEEDVKCAWRECEARDIKMCCSLAGKKYHFCKVHKSYHNVVASRWEDIKKALCEAEGGECTVCAVCGKAAKWLLADKTYCTTHKTNLMKRWDAEIAMKKFVPSKVKSISIDTLKLNLIRKLDNVPSLMQVDEVCIENQPSFKNPRMKAIADTLFTWFLIRGMVDRDAIKKVMFISPSNKLKIEDQEEEINEEIAASSNKYRTTKKLGIQHCKDILKYEPKYVQHLEKYSKQDDAADAFLQGVYYLDRYHKK